MNARLACACIFALALSAGMSACGSSSSGGSTGAGAAAATSGDAGPVMVLSDGCPMNSGYVGDDKCLAPPPADQGFQLHYGPPDYSKASDLSPYELAPNGEQVDCYYLKTPNKGDVYVGGYEFSMRPGSHHLNVDVNTAAQADGFATCQANDQSPGLLGGTETPVVDERVDTAPENAGLAVKLPADSQAVMNFHVINTGTVPILREAWLNYFYMDAADVKGLRGNVFL
ncbi:MAG TPA: hypothetical protein VHV30_07640, partial [Polyangiaceae bacterium]|nr:hypothetical protein [Polyangiaceae bacterium]